MSAASKVDDGCFAFSGHRSPGTGRGKCESDHDIERPFAEYDTAAAVLELRHPLAGFSREVYKRLPFTP